MKFIHFFVLACIACPLWAQQKKSDLFKHSIREGNDFIEVTCFSLNKDYNQFEVIRTDGRKAISLGTFANRYTKGDTIFFFYNDRKAEKGKLYQYAFIPLKADGSKGVAGESVMGSTKNFGNYYFRKTDARTAALQQGIRLSWLLSSTDNIKSIEIFRSENSESGYTLLGTVPSTDTAYTDVAIVPDRIYYYYLRAQNFVNHETIESGIFFDRGMPVNNPLAPTLQWLVQTDGGVTAKVQLSEPHLANVQLLRRKTGSEQFSTVAVKAAGDTVVWLTDSSSISGAFEYAATTENLSRLKSSVSNVVGITVLDNNPPDYSGSFDAIADFGSVQLRWESTDASLFKLKRSEGGNTIWLNNGQPLAANRYSDANVQPGKTYEYVLLPMSEGGQTGRGLIASVTTPADALTTNETLRGTATSRGILLQWGALADLRVNNQKLFRYQPGSKAVSIATLPLNQLSYMDSVVKSGEQYRYFLVSVDANGKEGMPGNEIAVKAQ